MWDLIVSVPDQCLSFYFTTSLTVLAGRDNYNIHIGKRALFNVDYVGMSLSHYR